MANPGYPRRGFQSHRFRSQPIITGRNEVLAKVIFSQASVIHSVHRGGPVLPGGGVWSGGFLQILGGPPNFRGGPSPEYGQHSAGTHPTGMHSCSSICLLKTARKLRKLQCSHLTKFNPIFQLNFSSLYCIRE